MIENNFNIKNKFIITRRTSNKLNTFSFKIGSFIIDLYCCSRVIKIRFKKYIYFADNSTILALTNLPAKNCNHKYIVKAPPSSIITYESI